MTRNLKVKRCVSSMKCPVDCFSSFLLALFLFTNLAYNKDESAYVKDFLQTCYCFYFWLLLPFRGKEEFLYRLVNDI